MNGLSWLIYLADVAGTAKTLAWVVICGVPVVGLFSAIFGPLMAMMGEDLFEEKPPWRSILARSFKAVGIALCVSVGVVVVVPSSGTIYAIAASEMGEAALNSETGGKAVQALNAWLDRQISQKPEA